MLDPEAIEVDPDLLLFNATKAKSGNSGSRSVVLSDSRGRYVKPYARGPVRRIAVDATLRAAAPTRKSGGAGTGRSDRRGDLGRSCCSAKPVPWWSSWWMPAADGPEPDAERQRRGQLLTEAYENRDEVALIPFRGEQAEVLLPHPLDHSGPPPAGIDALRQQLTLAHGLTQAARVGAMLWPPVISARWWWSPSPTVAAMCP